MDKTSVLGLLIGLMAILGAQLLDGGHLSSILQPTAFLVVAGGTLGAVMLQSPYATFLRGVRMLRWVLYPPLVQYQQIIEQVFVWSQISRRDGLLALEGEAYELPDHFLRNGLMLLVDGTPPEHLREVLTLEIHAFEDEMRLSARIWESAGGYAPTIGILGAILGLIHVMENLADPSKLGAGIAVAFVATAYGVGLANLIFIPIAIKLKSHVDRLVIQREMMLDGLVGIASGDNPRLIENRLRAYLI
ncbi:MAG: flagellar motor protein [Pseudomonadota bacterium]